MGPELVAVTTTHTARCPLRPTGLGKAASPPLRPAPGFRSGDFTRDHSTFPERLLYPPELVHWAPSSCGTPTPSTERWQTSGKPLEKQLLSSAAGVGA